MQEGLNLFSLSNTSKIYLMDNEGKALHKWNINYSKKQQNKFRGFALQGNNNLIFIDYLQGIGLADNESDLAWFKNIRAHHEVILIENNTILTLDRKERNVTIDNETLLIEDEILVWLDLEGDIVKEISFFDSVKDTLDLKKLTDKTKRFYKPEKGLPYNIFHVNSLEFLKKIIIEFLKKAISYSQREILI